MIDIISGAGGGSCPSITPDPFSSHEGLYEAMVLGVQITTSPYAAAFLLDVRGSQAFQVEWGNTGLLVFRGVNHLTYSIPYVSQVPLEIGDGNWEIGEVIYSISGDSLSTRLLDILGTEGATVLSKSIELYTMEVPNIDPGPMPILEDVAIHRESIPDWNSPSRIITHTRRLASLA